MNWRSTISVTAGLLILAAALVGCPPDDDVAPENQLNQGPNQAVGDCVDIAPLWSSEAPPAGVALHFEARDCESGEPVEGLALEDFEIAEDGQLLAEDADLHRRSSDEARPYVVLVIDVTSEAQEHLDDIQDGARALVDELVPGMHVGIKLFDGLLTPTYQWQPPIDDADILHERIDDIADFSPDEPFDANVEGALTMAVDSLRSHLRAVYDRNHGGALPTGHSVLLTAGVTHSSVNPDDTSAHVADGRTSDGSSEPAVHSWAVTLNDEFSSTLSDLLGGEYWLREADPDELDTTLRELADDIEADISATYIAGYCSPARGGTASVEVSMDTDEGTSATFQISTNGFEDGCSDDLLTEECDERECGGFLCGSCSDTDAACDGADSGQCVHYCLHAVVCEDEDIVTDLGHDMNCFMGPTVTECADQCVDVSFDHQHCGDCGVQCTAPGSECTDGECLCPDGSRDCGGDCVDLDSNDEHCGQCGNACPDGIECEEGTCECDGGLVACDGECVDTTEDERHCGQCGNACGDDEHCDNGFCFCDEGLSLCGDECVDIFTDGEHCGGCDNVCGDGQSCDNASCVCDAEGEEVCDGVCLDVMDNDDHCGACDNACGDAMSCADGSCVCDDDAMTLCGDECVDTDDDADHCGGCGTVCPQGVDCVDGVCECGGDLEACGDECVDTSATPEHCGGCGQACDDGELCDGGVCEEAPLIDDKQISAGQDHTCMVATDGQATCWGLDDYSQSTPPPFSFVDLAVGDRYNCGVRADAFVTCWGRNFAGESSPPMSTTFVQVDAGTTHTCGITTDDEIECWGSNADGKASPPSGSFIQVAVHQDHSCAVATDGSIECWGEDDDVTDSKSDPPAGDFVEVSVGMHHSCGLESDGSVQCWGSNTDGRSDPPDQTFSTISLGGAHSCGITTDDEILCWGSNFADQTDAPSGSFADVSGGFMYTCALTVDDEVECWGDNDSGQADPP